MKEVINPTYVRVTDGADDAVKLDVKDTIRFQYKLPSGVNIELKKKVSLEVKPLAEMKHGNLMTREEFAGYLDEGSIIVDVDGWGYPVANDMAFLDLELPDEEGFDRLPWFFTHVYWVNK